MRTDAPLVSVICPTAGPGRFLDETVASVIAQTLASWELLLIDNGSARDLSALAARDARIRLFIEPHPGAARARNAGLRGARGELIAFLDHDDTWDPEKLAAQSERLLASPQLAGVYNRFDVINDDGRRTGPGWAPATITLRGLSRAEELLTGSNLLLRRATLETIGLLDESLVMTDDADLLFRITREHHLELIDRVLTHYRLHNRNTTRDYALVHAEMALLIARYSPNRADRRAGLRRIGATYSAQAFDVFRETRRSSWLASLPHLARSLRMDWRWPLGQLVPRLARRS